MTTFAAFRVVEQFTTIAEPRFEDANLDGERSLSVPGAFLHRSDRWISEFPCDLDRNRSLFLDGYHL